MQFLATSRAEPSRAWSPPTDKTDFLRSCYFSLGLSRRSHLFFMIACCCWKAFLSSSFVTGFASLTQTHKECEEEESCCSFSATLFQYTDNSVVGPRDAPRFLARNNITHSHGTCGHRVSRQPRFSHANAPRSLAPCSRWRTRRRRRSRSAAAAGRVLSGLSAAYCSPLIYVLGFVSVL